MGDSPLLSAVPTSAQHLGVQSLVLSIRVLAANKYAIFK